jgi:hypothetical protein
MGAVNAQRSRARNGRLITSKDNIMMKRSAQDMGSKPTMKKEDTALPEEVRVAAEGYHWVAERERCDHEEVRETGEAKRVAGDSIRANDEQHRQVAENERVAAEHLREAATKVSHEVQDLRQATAEAQQVLELLRKVTAIRTESKVDTTH